MAASKGDELLTPESAYLPDSRNLVSGIHDISIQHRLISRYCLDDYVPEVIATQYEVARNLYLYAFHVYRFYMVAELQVMTTLEMAVKECFGVNELKNYAKEIDKRPGLYVCLRYIFDKGYVENSDFPAWHRRPRLQAQHEYSISKIAEMNAKGFESIDIDYSEAEVTTRPEDYDYLGDLLTFMPNLRNAHAHGDNILYDDILVSFENVSVIINKLYRPDLVEEKA